MVHYIRPTILKAMYILATFVILHSGQYGFMKIQVASRHCVKPFVCK